MTFSSEMKALFKNPLYKIRKSEKAGKRKKEEEIKKCVGVMQT
jgi:hypothetical protein